MKTERKTRAQLVKELEALRKINATIGTLLAPDAILQRIIDEIVPLFAAQAASVILFDYATQEAEITTAYGTQTRQGKPLRYPLRGTLSEWVAEHKRPLRLSRPSKNEWPTSATLAEQLGGSLEKISVLLAPLWRESIVIGCLEVVWDPQRDIADGDEQLLETIATQVAIAIANARLYQEKELALQAAKENEERYRTLIRDLNVGLMLFSPQAEILLANPAALHLLGFGEDQVLGRTPFDPMWDLIHEDGNPFPLETHPIPQALVTRRSVRNVVMSVYRPASGDRVWLLVNAEPQLNAEGKVDHVICTFSDITERKRIEEALHYQLAFEQIIASMSKDFIELAPEETDSGILRALKTIGEFSGVDRGYLFLFSENLAIMHNTHEWCASGVEPAIDRMRIVPTSSLPWAGEELRNARVVHISRANDLPLEAQTEKERMHAQRIQSVINVPIVLEKTLVGFLGFDALRAEKRWAEESITLLKVIGEIIANALERKRAAERQQQLQAQLLQAQKLEAVGTLAGGVAHDFNNLLAAIMGYTELVTDDVPSGSLARRNLEGILTATRRGKELVQQLLTFSRPRGEDRHPIQLHEVIEEALVFLRATVPKTIMFRFASRTRATTILADPTQIEQVVMNLCVNAAYAIGAHNGIIGIDIALVDENRAAGLVHAGVPGQSAYCLTVSDTGCGMTSAILGHIFEPFFTTKPMGQGSGMGLAMVHGIVTSHGGTMSVESQPGQGTTFRLYFPAFRGESDSDMLPGVIHGA